MRVDCDDERPLRFDHSNDGAGLPAARRSHNSPPPNYRPGLAYPPMDSGRPPNRPVGDQPSTLPSGIDVGG
jgi:hypothetical protein